ncbi:cytochrome c biogenesis CcdA family protein [Paraconexibacter sp.]|uniref:cytochrome c biogenesis CcdA family protein n=1 Tax=Paraconexibacter sp. TaxID=2949640 RepID=UPI003563980C
MTDPSAGVGVLAAMAAGMISFLSPCVLPLVPGYLSAISGVAPGERERASLRRVLVPSLLFVATFSLVFVALGVTATGIGKSLQTERATLEKISAAIIITLGVVFVAARFVPMLNREWHVGGLLERAGRGGPVLAGAAFAIAWTPCVGPTLGAILTAAALTESAGRGAYLMAWYSAGLAVPFLATAIFFDRATATFAVVKRHYGAVLTTGGLVLIAMGVLIWTGNLVQLNSEAQQLLDSLGITFLNEV